MRTKVGIYIYISTCFVYSGLRGNRWSSSLYGWQYYGLQEIYFGHFQFPNNAIITNTNI
jgi:hypothetical protein